jgi:hypothetical protein
MGIAVAASNTGTVTTAATSWAITLPTTGSTGDVYVIIVAAGGSTTMSTTSTGWSKIWPASGASVISAYVGVQGTAGTLTVASSGSQKAAYAGRRLTGAGSTGIAVQSATGSSNTHTSPSLTPSGGSQQYAWILADSSPSPPDSAPTGAPSGYTNYKTAASGTSDSSADAYIGTAELVATAATQTPGAWSGVVFSAAWTDLTIAVPAGAITGTDTGAGSDTAAVSAQEPGTETGGGTDSAPPGIGAPETGTGAEAAATAVQAPETGAGGEAATLRIPVSEVGAGGESAQVSAPVTAADTGAGGEAQTAAVAAPDTGAGPDTAAVAAQIPATDTGSGLDVVATGMGETDIGDDSAEVAVIGAGAPDIGSAADAGTAQAHVGVSDTGAGTDTGAAVVQRALGETGAGTDTIAVSVAVPTGDAATATDTTGIGVEASDAETGSEAALSELAGILVPPDVLVYLVPPAYRVAN